MSPITTFILGLLIGIIIWWIIDSAFWRPSAQELLAAKDSQERMQIAEAEVAGLKEALHKEQLARSNAESRTAALQSALSMTESAQMTAVSELDALHVKTSARKKPPSKPTTAKPAVAKPVAAKPTPKGPTAPEKVADPDDLTVVEGIGPKIDGVLKAAGITTYVQLSETAVETLEEILVAAGGRYRLAVPATWPEQAQLAAEEAWSALKALQSQLKRGRRAAK